MNANARERPTLSLDLHPEAAKVPEMSPDQYKVFLADVKARGILDPIETIPGTRTVIEGRTRLRAAKDAGLAVVPVVDADLNGDTPVVYMLRKALLRRHLTPGQRAAMGNEIKKQLRAQAKERQRAGAAKGGSAPKVPEKVREAKPDPAAGKKDRSGEAGEQAAKIAGTNARYIAQAEKVEQKAPEVYEQLKAGAVTLPQAVAVAKLAEQKPGLTYLTAVPKFPKDAILPLSGNGIRTLADLDARLAELQKKPGRGTATRYDVFRDVGLGQKLACQCGDALVDATAPLSAAATAKSAQPAAPTKPPELKPCPFCGSIDVDLVSMGIYVHCKDCMACGPSPKDPTPAHSRAAWNKRAKVGKERQQ
jgi:Lar family restriction alleviation protein